MSVGVNNYLYRTARGIKNSVPLLRRLYARLNSTERSAGMAGDEYVDRLAAEKRIYKDVEDINVLPAIFHYWSNKYLRPMLEQYGVSNPDQFFCKYMRESAERCGMLSTAFVSIGAGNCDTEVRVAKLLRNAGLRQFTIDCLDMNPHMLKRGFDMAVREGVAEHIIPVESDFNNWRAAQRYAGVIANQSLHHVVNLEGLFDEIKRALHPAGYFMTSDVIGRNGHQRWPEALDAVQDFWRELPKSYRYNRQLDRHEEVFNDWDCSQGSFEGIRAQDVLPLLLDRFDFQLFIGFANVIDVFIDRSFGHNFDAEAEWDRAFIDRIHAFDEAGLASGTLKPTHMMAVMTPQPAHNPCYARGLSPHQSMRRPD